MHTFEKPLTVPDMAPEPVLSAPVIMPMITTAPILYHIWDTLVENTTSNLFYLLA